jgi:hypothetical protein
LHVLGGRILLQTTPHRVSYIKDQVDPVHSGLILSGAKALDKTRTLREDGSYGPLLADPAIYEQAAACEEEPFPSLGQLSFGDPLENSVAEQLAHGASAAMTPTGYLHAEDSDALKAAARCVRDLSDPRVIFTVPVDVGWLRDDAVGQLIAILNLVPNTKAVMLGGQMDPLARFPAAVANLRRLLSEVPDTALLRTDLAAFGALAGGACFTAFGAGSRVRHIVPPPQPAKTSRNGGPNSPHVLFPELMDFFLGRTLADRFAGARAPVCHCAVCAGRLLDAFPSNTFQVPAAAHNAAVLMDWLRQMAPVPADQRGGWWQRRCQQAMDRYPLLNAELDQPGAFTPPTQLKRWAQLPVTAASPVPVVPGQESAGHHPRR